MPTENIVTKVLVQNVNGVPSFITTGTFYLRKYPYTSNTYTAYPDENGIVTFTGVYEGFYRMYNSSDVQVSSFGTVWIGDENIAIDTILVGTNPTVDALTVSGVSKFWGDVNLQAKNINLAWNVQCNNINEYLTGNGIRVDGILLKDNLETSGIAGLTSNNSFTGSNTFTTRSNHNKGIYVTGGSTDNNKFYNKTEFHNEPPYTFNQPTVSNHIPNKYYVDTTISAAISNISVSGSVAHQMSPNVLRLIIGGVTENNRVYTSWALAQTSATGVASSSKLVTIEIDGMDTDSYINTSYGLPSGVSSFNEYISVKGENQNVRLLIPANVSLTGGKTSVENVTMYSFTNDDSYTITGLKFKDVVVDLLEAGNPDGFSLSLINCEFDGIVEFRLSPYSNLYTTSCTGNYQINNTNYFNNIVNTGMQINGDLSVTDNVSISGSVAASYSSLTSFTKKVSIYVDGIKYYVPLELA